MRQKNGKSQQKPPPRRQPTKRPGYRSTAVALTQPDLLQDVPEYATIRPMREKAILQMQQRYGNAVVQRILSQRNNKEVQLNRTGERLQSAGDTGRQLKDAASSRVAASVFPPMVQRVVRIPGTYDVFIKQFNVAYHGKANGKGTSDVYQFVDGQSGTVRLPLNFRGFIQIAVYLTWLLPNKETDIRVNWPSVVVSPGGEIDVGDSLTLYHYAGGEHKSQIVDSEGFRGNKNIAVVIRFGPSGLTSTSKSKSHSETTEGGGEIGPIKIGGSETETETEGTTKTPRGYIRPVKLLVNLETPEPELGKVEDLGVPKMTVHEEKAFHFEKEGDVELTGAAYDNFVNYFKEGGELDPWAWEALVNGDEEIVVEGYASTTGKEAKNIEYYSKSRIDYAIALLKTRLGEKARIISGPAHGSLRAEEKGPKRSERKVVVKFNRRSIGWESRE